MGDTKKLGFFSRLKMTLFGLENYIEFTAERFSKSFGFMMKMIVIFALIFVVSNIAFIYLKYNGPVDYIQSVVPEFTYENDKIIIDEGDKKDENKKVVANLMQQLEPTYKQILPNETFRKADIVEYVSQNEKSIILMTSVFIFFGELIDLLVFWLMVALLTSMIGLIILTFSRIKMKYSKLFALSIYASTLTIILTVVYSILNTYFNIYIEVFEYLSMLIAYIYITAVIYMIRSDLIKQQLELIKIATVQAKVKEQMEKESDEQKEKDDDEPKDEKKDKEQKEEDNKIPDEPDGSEI